MTQPKPDLADAIKDAPENDQAAIDKLAKLAPMEYDRVREAEAKKLNCRVATLDREVARARGNSIDDDNGGSGSAVLFADPEPWPDAVDGTALLADIAETFAERVVLPEGAADVLALWVLHAHAHDAAYVSPILVLQSPEKQCGKTTTFTVLQTLVPRVLPTSNITSAALFRAVEKWRPTLLIDEADSFLRDNEDLRGILNSGHVRTTAFVIRTVGDEHEPKTFSTWGPKAIALIGKCRPEPGAREVGGSVLYTRQLGTR